MENHDLLPSGDVSEPLPAKFSIVDLLKWLAVSLILSAMLAFLAFEISQFASPMGLFSLGVGCALGGSLVVAMRAAQVGHRVTLVAGMLIAVLVVVVGQHYASYLSERSQAEKMRSRFEQEMAKSAPGVSPNLFENQLPTAVSSFREYMMRQATVGRPITATISLHGINAWASWAVDGLLVGIACFFITFLAMRRPYCDKCHSWYRTVRKGVLREAALKDLTQSAAVAIPGDAKSANIVMESCMGGCGPTRMGLDAGRSHSPVKIWLSEATRDEVTRILDATH